MDTEPLEIKVEEQSKLKVEEQSKLLKDWRIVYSILTKT